MRFALLLLATGCRFAFDATEQAADAAAGDGVEPDAIPAAISALQISPMLSVDAVGPYVVTFSAPTTTGNAIAVLAWSWAGGATTYPSNGVTDAAGNSYTQLRTHVLGGCAGGTGGAAIYVAPAITGTANHAISLTVNGVAMQQVALLAVEYRGLSATPFLSAISSVSNSLSPLAINTGTVAINQPDTLLLTVATVCGGYPDPVTWSNGNGAVTRGVEPVTFERAPGIAGDRVVGAGTADETWSVGYTGVGPVDGIGLIAAVR